MRCENKTFLQNDPGFLQEISSTAVEVGLNAPPTASQASVPGVAIETQLCSNDANVSGRTVAPTYST